MRRRPRRLETAPLVDRDVDQTARRFIRARSRGRRVSRAGARHQHGANDDVGADDLLLDGVDVEIARATRPTKISSRTLSRGIERSRIMTSAPRPAAIRAACVPTTPPPRTAIARRNTGNPTDQLPAIRRSSYAAPAASMASRPATSLIGASSGRPPWASVTVS